MYHMHTLGASKYMHVVHSVGFRYTYLSAIPPFISRFELMHFTLAQTTKGQPVMKLSIV